MRGIVDAGTAKIQSPTWAHRGRSRAEGREGVILLSMSSKFCVCRAMVVEANSRLLHLTIGALLNAKLTTKDC